MFHYFLSIQLTGAYLVFILVMFFFCLFMYKQNKILKLEIEKLKEEQLSFMNKKGIKKDADTVSIKEISKDMLEEEIANKKVSDKEIKVSNCHSNTKDVKISNRVKDENRVRTGNHVSVKCTKDLEINDSRSYQDNCKVDTNKRMDNVKILDDRNPKNYYSKNVLQGKKQVTSPVSINNDVFDMDKLSFDLNEFIKREKKVVPRIRERESGSDYLKELSMKLASEIEPQTIELTDYEKKQEENAIISYQELLKVKDQIYSIDDEVETVDFIEELKSFRNSLNE